MPPLKRLKHEQFVQAFPDKPSAVQAYQSVYHNASYGSARARACALMAKEEIKTRLLEVFQEKGINDDFIANGLKKLTNANKENVRLGSFRTILEVRKDIDSSSNIGIQLNLETEEKAKLLERMKRYSEIISAE